MKYLNKLFKRWKDSSKKETQFGSNVTENEPLARFLTEKDKRQKLFDEVKGFVKPAKFKPGKDNDLSMYRIIDCPDKEIWHIADEYFTGATKDKSEMGVVALAQISASAALQYPVTLEADGIPHPRHVNIKYSQSAMERRQEIAAAFSKQATLKSR